MLECREVKAVVNPAPCTRFGEGSVIGPSSVLFPLTLTLSPRERESPRTLLDDDGTPPASRQHWDLKMSKVTEHRG